MRCSEAMAANCGDAGMTRPPLEREQSGAARPAPCTGCCTLVHFSTHHSTRCASGNVTAVQNQYLPERVLARFLTERAEYEK